MVALDPVRLLLADVEAALRDRLAVGRPVVRAVQAHAPALQALEKSFESGPVTTAQLPVDDPSGSTIPSLQTQSLLAFFLKSATSRPARPRRHGPPARAFARKLWRTARSRSSRWASTPRAAWRCGSSRGRSGRAAPP